MHEMKSASQSMSQCTCLLDREGCGGDNSKRYSITSSAGSLSRNKDGWEEKPGDSRGLVNE